jgi:hypothetical protein
MVDVLSPPRAVSLPVVPVIDIGRGGAPALLRQLPDRADALLAAATRSYTRVGIGAADAVSRRWAARHPVPYQDELYQVAELLGRPGAWMLNLSYEWGCTTGIAAAPDGRGMEMKRTLDWPLDGLGTHVVVSRQTSGAGMWFNVTWPGFVGVTTALAPGRFAAALNQAPMTKRGLGLLGDWAVNRWRVWRHGRTPPALLLRRAFDECAGFDDAVRLLTETPVSLPAIYTLAGASPDRGVVIERLETEAWVHPAPVCVTNHWLSPHLNGRPRSRDSHDRLAAMRGRLIAVAGGLTWLQAPIVNDATRLAVTANAVTGELTVQGFEAGAPATSILRLVA